MNLADFWEKIPAPLRTIVNVALGAALAALVAYSVTVVQGQPFDPRVLLAGLFTAVATAVVRAINPADTAYGIGSTQPMPTGPVQDVPSA